MLKCKPHLHLTTSSRWILVDIFIKKCIFVSEMFKMCLQRITGIENIPYFYVYLQNKTTNRYHYD